MTEKTFSQKNIIYIGIALMCLYISIFENSQISRLIDAFVTAFINLMNNVVAKDAFSTVVISGIVALAGKHFGKRKVKIKK